jgi:hypothetical protein
MCVVLPVRRDIMKMCELYYLTLCITITGRVQALKTGGGGGGATIGRHLKKRNDFLNSINSNNKHQTTVARTLLVSPV